jgi:hypothetical protein
MGGKIMVGTPGKRIFFGRAGRESSKNYHGKTKQDCKGDMLGDEAIQYKYDLMSSKC